MNGVLSDPQSPLPQSLLLCEWKKRTKEEAPLPKRPEGERHRRGRVSLLPSNHCVTLHCPSLPAYLSHSCPYSPRQRTVF